MKIFITGATGFIGSSLIDFFAKQTDIELFGAARNKISNNKISYTHIGDISESTDWLSSLHGIDVIIHLAGRAHILNEKSQSPISEFRKVNLDITINLARQAISCGVKRFIFISSIGVNGSRTLSSPFTEESTPAPHTDYAISKLEAENALRELVKSTKMELVIIRPPLVYAGHAPGNFKNLLNIIKNRLPLPFGLIENRRSLVALENLVDFISCCTTHPAAANQLFLISDGTDVSTKKISRLLAEGMNRKIYLLPIPDILIKLSSILVGRRALYTQLCESLVINSNKARRILNWTPPIDTSTALLKSGKCYTAKKTKNRNSQG